MDLPGFERREGLKIYRYEREFPVGDASPATANNGVDIMAAERRGEIYRKLLVKKNEHQPTG